MRRRDKLLVKTIVIDGMCLILGVTMITMVIHATLFPISEERLLAFLSGVATMAFAVQVWSCFKFLWKTLKREAFDGKPKTWIRKHVLRMGEER